VSFKLQASSYKFCSAAERPHVVGYSWSSAP
jgi:hypothetical protein